MSACTCSPCGRDFTGLSAFDRHQDVNYSRRPPVVCLDPATVGLETNAHGRWGFPASADSRARLQNLRAERDQARVVVSPEPEKASTGTQAAMP